MKKLLSLLLCLALMCSLLAVGASAYDVVLSPQKLMVNGQYVECEKYNIDGSNYFKLRDLAYLLMDTDAVFGVAYIASENAVQVVPGMPYEPNGSELVIGEDKSATAVPSAQHIWIMGTDSAGLSIYNIGGNNYFKLRDMGTALGFLVDFDAETNTAIVKTADYADASGGNVNQLLSFNRLWDWVQANSNGDAMGEKEYIESYEWDDGDAADYELVAAELGGEKTLILISTYYYSDGSMDITWIFLEAEAAAYYVAYDYYDVGNEDLTTSDFTGELNLVPAAFDGVAGLVFETVEGPLADQTEELGLYATGGVADTLQWLAELINSTPELDALTSITDFGFSLAALYGGDEA